MEIGKALVEVLATKNAAVIASSDLTHYEPQATAERKDMAVIKAAEAMDAKLLFSTIEEQNISACGYGPISTLITFAKGLGVKEAKLLTHKTSGAITNDYSSVVGYAAVSFKK
jgi:AmmeMemoRadiSam system protein B